MSLFNKIKCGKSYCSGSILDHKLAIRLTTVLGDGVKGVRNVRNI